MLSNRTLGKFFTIQSLCLEEVCACRVFLLARYGRRTAISLKDRCSFADMPLVEFSTLSPCQMNQLLA